MTDSDILNASKCIQQRAWNIIKQTEIIEKWANIGAETHIVGSLAMGLMMKHRDIDMHVYSSTLSIKNGFNVMAHIAETDNIKKIEYHNLTNTDEACIEWHAWYSAENGETWQIDMIHILKGSFYDGYFENVAKQIIAAMSPKQQETIIRLKFETPDDVKISGMEYYKAVIQDNVQSFEELLQWRRTHHFDTLIKW